MDAKLDFIEEYDEAYTAKDLDGYEGALGGITRREFLKYCTGIAVGLGLSPAFGVKIAEAATQKMRPPVIWLSAQACTGCTESLLRAYNPTLETLILDHISLEYNEALCAGAGHQAEEHKDNMMKEHFGKYILVVDGSIPEKDDGVYCKVAGKTMQESISEASKGAAIIIAMGTCSSWGGMPSSGGNPTEATGTPQYLAKITDKPVITIPGCPPNPYNFLSTVLYVLTFGKAPQLDDKGRPKFAYGRLIHENCERRPHFDAGRFALEFGDEGHRRGYCLYKLGCKGPETYANCPAVGFGDVGEGAWPVGAGHPCFGCTEEGIGFEKPIHSLADVKTFAPPAAFPKVAAPQGEGMSAGAGAIVGAVAGAAVAGAAVMTAKLKTEDEAKDDE